MKAPTIRSVRLRTNQQIESLSGIPFLSSGCDAEGKYLQLM
jgi:hypothetical protein